ncbi:LysR family transcriptional regulator [Massilia timonae]|uniref:LysR substrate-binding domain-containing protein n=1 Tax=Massilia timonae TaxID=47229 RepID=UPI0028D64457|nr:LysR family transcriptional regulator [Massilia timonae]
MNQLLAMRAFARVIDTGSFSRASDQLGLPRSTVSKLIGDLEVHLGNKLMHRTTRTVAATAEGMAYYQQSVRLLAELDAMDHAMRGQKRKPRGHLRIDAPASFATSLLIPALPAFHREYPDITLALGVSDRPANIVGEGVDCVIRAGEVQQLSMVGRKLLDLHYGTYASPAYLERAGTPRTPADLAQHVRLGYFFAATTKPNPLIFERCDERLEIEASELSTNDGNGLLALLRAGLGIGQHFTRMVQPAIDAGELTPVLQEWRRPAMPFQILYPPNRHQNARLTVFVDWLIDTFRDLGDPGDRPLTR